MGRVGMSILKGYVLRPGVYHVRSPVKAFAKEIKMARPRATAGAFIVAW